MYIDVLMCMVYKCTRLNCNGELLGSAVRFMDEDSRWMRRHAHGINRFSLLRQWSFSCLPTCQHTCMLESETSDRLTVYCCFFDVHINVGMTLNLLQCLCVVCGWWTITDHQCGRHHWDCWIWSQYNQLRLASIFFECTSNWSEPEWAPHWSWQWPPHAE